MRAHVRAIRRRRSRGPREAALASYRQRPPLFLPREEGIALTVT